MKNAPTGILRSLASTVLVFALFSDLAWAQDSAETHSEQALSEAAEQNPGQFAGSGAPAAEQPQGPVLQPGPLFIGVDDASVPAERVDVLTNAFSQAFTGYAVWGAAYDASQNRVLFNSGSILYEWPVGGSVNQLGTIVDGSGGSQAIVGLAFHNGVLYGTKNIANEAIYIIDTTTGLATVHIDYEDTDLDCGGLAVDPDTGDFYCTNDDATPYGAGLIRINGDATATLIAAYPDGQTDIDGLAIGNGYAYLVTDEPGSIYVWDFSGGAFVTPLTNPWTTSETFSAGAYIPVPEFENETTFTVNKVFSDDNPASVDFAINCDGATVIDNSGGVSGATKDSPAIFTLGWDPGEDPPTCTVTEINWPDGYTPDESNCLDVELDEESDASCTITNTQDPVTVYIDKVFGQFHPNGDSEFDFTLDCDSATINGQAGTATATTVLGRAEFTVTDFPWDGSNCFATEAAKPGYVQDTTDDSCGTDAENPGFSVVPGGTDEPIEEAPVGLVGLPAPACTFTNRPTEAVFTVDKQFSDGNLSLGADIVVTCTDDDDGPGIVTDPDPAEGTAGENTDFEVTIRWLGSNASCTATETDLVGYTQITDPGGDDCGTDQAIDDTTDNSCVIFNDQDPIEIHADKIYSSGGGSAVDFAVECTNLDTGGSVTPSTDSASPGNPAIFTVNDVMWDGSTICTVSEPVAPGGYWETDNTCTTENLDMTPNSDDPRTCAITNSPTRATFRVTKQFADGNNVDDIEVSIDCNTGLILDQDKDLGDGEWVEFVVTDFTDGLLECTITEDGQAGYSGEYDNVTRGNIISDESCEYPAESITVDTSAHECVITNSPDPVEVTINKEWVVEGTANAFSAEYEIELYCSATDMSGPGAEHDDGNSWSGWAAGDGEESFTWYVTPLFPNSVCTAYESGIDSYVEVDNPCDELEISVGNGAECTITNTVFFEGIPTLSQYGMAIMALLMLGVGLVGFRRFS